jgi:hypothetical protein
MAFTGADDTVPWVVWYEQDDSGVGLHNNEMVFAAKATSTSSADGQFQWTAVGINGTGLLDTSGSTPTNNKPFGSCATSTAAEEACSVNANADADADAEDPSIASGTMTAGNPTVPWIVWDEGSAASPNNNGVFVARLVGAGAAARFVIANAGQPIGTGDRADITFSGNTPYVTWHHNGQIVVGHFATPDQFVNDPAPVGSNETDTVRAPISSACIATPFNGDGSTCQAGAVGTPFFLYTDGNSSNAKLLADAYQPDTIVTAAPSNIATIGGMLNGSVNPEGAAVNTSFQFGPTTAYGSTTAAQKSAVSDSPAAFSANLAGLAPGTTIHYRAVVTSDFGTSFGGDQTLTTLSANGNESVGNAHVKGTAASVRVACAGVSGQTCSFAFRMTVTKKIRGHKVIAITARKKPKTRKIVTTVGSAHGLTLAAGQSAVVRVSLNGTGKRLLSSRRKLKVTLDVTRSTAVGAPRPSRGRLPSRRRSTRSTTDHRADRPVPRPRGDRGSGRSPCSVQFRAKAR